MSKVYYLDGAFVSAEAATIPVTDLSIVRGYGVFDFFRTYNGKPIQIERNITRLRNSARLIELDLPWSDEDITNIVLQCVERNGFDESNIRIIVTGGDSPNFITPDNSPRLIVYVEPLIEMPAHWYTDGIKVITLAEERYLPGSKSLAYIPAILGQKRAKEAGAIEALYIDRDNNVREGTTSNIFAFYGDQVITPETHILPGVTRGRVMEIVSQNYTLVERPLPYEELLRADELVLTSANKQVVPVVQMDEHIYTDKPGEHSKWLMHAFKDYVTEQANQRDTVQV